ncbi:MAG: tautomerase family protein [Klebsiella pneumoniae]|nr:tautomerase family protein [Klebsiella pneumoniae]
MPLTRISLGTAWRPAEFAQLSALFHECLVAEFDVPSADRFQFIERAADEQRIYDPHYLSEGRSARFVLFHIFAGKPRSLVIQFNQLEDWSFSAGKMADE